VRGRLIRTLADQSFTAGEHLLRWDGKDDHGRHVPRGMYWTRIRYLGNGFSEVTKITVLK
jgi:flagellar hook assembly protein FlgD